MGHFRRWQLELQQVPPDQRTRDIFSYPIFRFNAGGKRRHISGRIRSLLNDNQALRWDYFFRPNLYLLRAADDAAYISYQAELTVATRKLNALNDLPDTEKRLEEAKTRRFLLFATLWICAGASGFGYIFFNMFFWIGTLVFSVLTAFVCFSAIPTDVIADLERAKQRLTIDIDTSPDTTSDISQLRSDVVIQIERLKHDMEAIIRFHHDLAAQRPVVTLNVQDMDAILKGAVKHLVDREKRRLNYFDDERSLAFDPIVRWALETDRKQALDSLKPSVYSIARRDSLYARYHVQVIFVHRGQLSLYQGFFDLILGEFLGEFRSHVLLANLFQVQDETTTDFDFRRRLQDAITMSSDNTNDDLSEPDEVFPDAVDDENLEGAIDEIGVIQTTTVRLIGNGEPVSLKFVVSGHRESLIAQLQAQRIAEEQAIANLEARGRQEAASGEPELVQQLRAHEERLLRIKEAEDSETRRATTYNVEGVVNQILEHTRHVVSARAN